MELLLQHGDLYRNEIYGIFYKSLMNQHLNISKYILEMYPQIVKYIYYKHVFTQLCTQECHESLQFLFENFSPHIIKIDKYVLNSKFTFLCRKNNLQMAILLKKNIPSLCLNPQQFELFKKEFGNETLDWIENGYPIPQITKSSRNF